jgi:DNA ligase-1
MTSLSALVILCLGLESTPGRLDKLRLVTDFLSALGPDEAAGAVAYLTGRACYASDLRVVSGVGLPVAGAAAVASLTLADVDLAFAAVATATGAGSRRMREERLTALAARATGPEQAWLRRIITGEMRTGVSDGLVLEAIGRAAGADATALRRAALFLGDLSLVATTARAGGAAALAAAAPRLFVPLSPMLAEATTDWDQVLAAHGGRTGLEYKYDGARIQLHSDGDRVGVWTRRLSDVTPSLPDVAMIARTELRSAPFILDGEVVALDPAGRPLPFQELMRRFRRVHRRRGPRREMPLGLFFFDCLVAGGPLSMSRMRRARAALADHRGRYPAERLSWRRADAAHASRSRLAGPRVTRDLRSAASRRPRQALVKVKEAQSWTA